MLFGLLNVNKPAGVTSRDVVNQVQRLIKPVRIGHAGTLDPMATGVLLLVVGPATRLVESLHRFPKQYRGTFLLGRMSDTEDIEGRVEELTNPPRPTADQIERLLPTFRGTIQQVPPAYSALKVAGRRAHALARQGEPVVLEPRSITIHELQLVRYDYPELELELTCSSGTYVRSLGRDLARALGTEAVMSQLTRTAIGHFLLENACQMGELTRETLADRLLTPLEAIRDWPRRLLTSGEITELRHGRRIPLTLEADVGEARDVAGCDADGRLLALLQIREGWLYPVRNFGDLDS